MNEFENLNGYGVADKKSRNSISKFDFSEIMTTKHRDEVSGTDYYITRINATDKFGNKNILRVGIANDDETITTVESPIDFAHRKNTPVCINAGIFYSEAEKPCAYGMVIKDGVILKNQVSEDPIWYPYLLGINANGTLMDYTSDGSITGEQLINAGVVDCILGFYPLIKNGVACDTTNYQTKESAPRQVICQNADGSYLIFTCEGRTTNNTGMTVDDLIRVLLTLNVNFAFNLDGGGSVSTVVKGNKINNDYDDYGRKDRKVATMLYLEKVSDEIYARVGKIERKMKSEQEEKFVSLYESDGTINELWLGDLSKHKKMKIYYKSDYLYGCKEILLNADTIFTNILESLCIEGEHYLYTTRYTITRATGKIVADRRFTTQILPTPTITITENTDIIKITRIDVC